MTIKILDSAPRDARHSKVHLATNRNWRNSTTHLPIEGNPFLMTPDRLTRPRPRVRGGRGDLAAESEKNADCNFKPMPHPPPRRASEVCGMNIILPIRRKETSGRRTEWELSGKGRRKEGNPTFSSFSHHDRILRHSDSQKSPGNRFYGPWFGPLSGGLQGDTSRWSNPPVDTKTRVVF